MDKPMVAGVPSKPQAEDAGRGANQGGPEWQANWRSTLAEMLRRVFQKTPNERQIEVAEDLVRKEATAQQFIRRVMSMKSATANHFVYTHTHSGHYYSPVVDTDLVGGYVKANRTSGASGVPGVEMSLEAMEAFWRRNQKTIAETPFPNEKDDQHRYSFLGGPYGFGDGTTLRAMIADLRPKRIIEIGSGYSTACMLDAADEFGLDDLRITCVEPFPARLKSVLKPGDMDRIEIIEQGVQGFSLARVAELEANDILFIDSTHVLKTGSDVHYELFYMLPALKKGVVVHFHDCRWPMEYSDIQIFQKNYSWNEAYGVLAFLMYNSRFRVRFSGSFFAEHRADLIGETFPAYLRNSGSALWLEVTADGQVLREDGPIPEPIPGARASEGNVS